MPMARSVCYRTCVATGAKGKQAGTWCFVVSLIGCCAWSRCWCFICCGVVLWLFCSGAFLLWYCVVVVQVLVYILLWFNDVVVLWWYM